VRRVGSVLNIEVEEERIYIYEGNHSGTFRCDQSRPCRVVETRLLKTPCLIRVDEMWAAYVSVWVRKPHSRADRCMDFPLMRTYLVSWLQRP
jgi:hypothetical protein